jgi:hypothetical protein
LLSDLHLVALDLRVGCDCLLLLGVSQHPRWLGAAVVIELAIGDLFEPSPSDCEGFLILSAGVRELDTLVELVT